MLSPLPTQDIRLTNLGNVNPLQVTQFASISDTGLLMAAASKFALGARRWLSG